ncbi:DUF4038 domain-containing protein [Vibrio sp. PP-XX7]
MKINLIRILLCSLIIICSAVHATNNTIHGRLEVAANGRYLQYEDKTPFFYLGDTAWSLFHRLNREEADLYLNDRAKKGFTVIQAVALAELDGLTKPNPYGDLPLMNLDPSQPNEKYFQHVDYIVEQAESLGLHIGFLPTWGKYWKSGDATKIFTPENAKTYGRFLGQRYRDKPIIWILGGDQNVVTQEERSIIDAMAAGLREGDGGGTLSPIIRAVRVSLPHNSRMQRGLIFTCRNPPMQHATWIQVFTPSVIWH